MKIWVVFKEEFYGDKKWFKIYSCHRTKEEAEKEIINKDFFVGELIKNDN